MKDVAAGGRRNSLDFPLVCVCLCCVTVCGTVAVWRGASPLLARLHRSVQELRHSKMPKSSRDQHKILVVGLPPGSSSTDLIKLVKPYGNPLNAHMAVDAEGKERGFGFVQFSDASTQQSAIAALDKTALAGRTLNVRAVEERAPGGGSFSGRGGVGGSAATGKNKGRPCYDFARGMCARGASCKWAHMAPKRGGNVEVAAARGE